MSLRENHLLKGNILYGASAYMLLGVSLLTEAVMLVALRSGAVFPGEPYGAQYNAVMLLVEFIAIALPGVIFCFTRFRGNIPMRLAFRPSALLAIPAAIAGYIFVMGISLNWGGLLQSLGLGTEPGAALPQNNTQLIASLFIIAVSPALCEEFLFRALIMPLYERHFRSPVAAVALSGLVFGLMHGQVSGAPGQIFLGLVIGFVVIATGSIWAGVLYHFTNNAVAMLLAYFSSMAAGAEVQQQLPHMTMMASGMIFLLVGGIALGALLAAFYAIYHRRRPDAPLPPAPVASNEKSFIPWLPLAIALPVILFRYGMGLLTMIMSAAGWL